jgi:hypothetical protein
MVDSIMNVTANGKQDMMNVDSGEEFVVERIVSHRIRNGRKEYLLAWKGYPEEENTWVQRSKQQCVLESLESHSFCLDCLRSLNRILIVQI